MKKKFYYKRTSKKSYIITISTSEHGTITGPAVAYYGDKVTLTITPDSGYQLDTLKVMCDGKEIAVTDGVFTMPDGNVEITATFKERVVEKYVDLGLPSGLKWATCNVGAPTSEKYGNLYAWGEIATKTTYDWATYKYTDGSSTVFTKYCNDARYGTVDNKTTLEAEDDAATANLGSEWRMPTKDEWQELIDKCTWTWTTLNGVNGIEVKATNGNSIFLPAAGYRYDDELYNEGLNGYYWSSSLGTDNPHYAQGVDFYSGNQPNINNDARCCGRSVRPVLDPHKLTLTYDTTQGTATLSQDKAYEDTEITVNVTPSSGYELSSITVNGTAITGNTFTMPDSDVSVVVEFYLLNGIKYTASKDIKNDVASTTASGAQLILDKCTYNASTTEGILMYNQAPTEIDDSYFEGNTDLTSINIPASIDSIQPAAFKGCSNLKSVTILDGLTTIADEAFLGCESLNSITIPNTVTAVGEQAFENCEALTTAIISDNVTWLSHTTFGGCTNLTSVIIGSKVTYVDYYAFQNCSQLTSIYCKAIEAPQLATGVSPFSGISKTGVLHVPSEALYNYGKWSSALGTGWSIVNDL